MICIFTARLEPAPVSFDAAMQPTRLTLYGLGQSPGLNWLFVFFLSSLLFLGLSKRFGIDHFILQGVPDFPWNGSWCIDGSRNNDGKHSCFDRRQTRACFRARYLFFSFSEKSFSFSFSTLAILHFPLFYFLSLCICLSFFLSHSLTDTGRQVTVHVCTEHYLHRLSTLVAS